MAKLTGRGSRPTRPKRKAKGKRAAVPAEQGHAHRFDQMLGDAIFGAKKK